MIPLLAAGIPAVLASVAGALDIAHKAKQLKGSGVRRRNYRRRGRGVVSDLLKGIPLIGPIIGGLAGNIGLGMKRTKRSLAYASGRGLAVMHPKKVMSGRRGHGLAVMHAKNLGHLGGRLRPGKGGLLNAAGGRIRRGHYRYIKKGAGVKRIHVRAHKVGGYTPFY